MDLAGGCDRINREITLDIDQTKGDRDALLSLLHEMCHAATTGSHGKSWQEEMKRIIRAGVHTLRADLEKHARLYYEEAGRERGIKTS